MWDILIILGLVTWRLAYMLVSEQGPFDIFIKLREGFGIGHDADDDPVSYPDTFFGNLFSCVYCMSIWVACGFYLLSLVLPDFIFMLVSIPFAVSTIAIIIDTIVEKH